MAGIARRSARMLNGIYLRKTLGLGANLRNSTVTSAM
jgi:hypothetical protein